MDTREKCLKALADIEATLTKQFPEARARLEQLSAHLKTVAMLVDHVHDEAEREAAAR